MTSPIVYLLFFVFGFDQRLVAFRDHIGQFVVQIFLFFLVPLRCLVLLSCQLTDDFVARRFQLVPKLLSFARHTLELVFVAMLLLTYGRLLVLLQLENALMQLIACASRFLDLGIEVSVKALQLRLQLFLAQE